MLEKTTDSNIIDGGDVICGELDKKNGISKNNFLANWLITKKAIYYCYPQNEYIKEFTFFDWEISTHLGNYVKKKKEYHAIRIFKISNHRNSNLHLLRRTFDNMKSSVEFYDFYVINGKELNIATVHSLFKDNKGYIDEL